MHISIKLIKIAQELDYVGLYKQADVLTNIAKIVVSQSSGPNNMNLSLETRVIPFSEMETEYKDVEKKRRQYHPRLTPKEHEKDDAGDIRDIYGPQGETEQNRDNAGGNNIFDINNKYNFENGCSEFSM